MYKVDHTYVLAHPTRLFDSTVTRGHKNRVPILCSSYGPAKLKAHKSSHCYSVPKHLLS